MHRNLAHLPSDALACASSYLDIGGLTSLRAAATLFRDEVDSVASVCHRLLERLGPRGWSALLHETSASPHPLWRLAAIVPETVPRRMVPPAVPAAIETSLQASDDGTVLTCEGSIGMGDRSAVSDVPWSPGRGNLWTPGSCPWGRALSRPRPFVAPFLGADGVLHAKPRLVAYFEATIVGNPAPQNNTHHAPRECVAIGVSASGFAAARMMPGWDEASWGYHSDDGGVFHASGSMLREYGPSFGAGDVVGCGVDWSKADGRLGACEIFFTLNGKFLGTAFSNVRAALSPVVGADTTCSVTVNLGADAFNFNLAEYIANSDHAATVHAMLADPAPALDVEAAAAPVPSAPAALLSPMAFLQDARVRVSATVAAVSAEASATAETRLNLLREVLVALQDEMPESACPATLGLSDMALSAGASLETLISEIHNGTDDMSPATRAEIRTHLLGAAFAPAFMYTLYSAKDDMLEVAANNMASAGAGALMFGLGAAVRRVGGAAVCTAKMRRYCAALVASLEDDANNMASADAGHSQAAAAAASLALSSLAVCRASLELAPSFPDVSAVMENVRLRVATTRADLPDPMAKMRRMSEGLESLRLRGTRALRPL